MSDQNQNVKLSPDMSVLAKNFANSPGYQICGTSIVPRNEQTTYHKQNKNKEKGMESSIFPPDQKRLL